MLLVAETTSAGVYVHCVKIGYNRPRI